MSVGQIYSFGEIGMVTQALNAVAMIFNSSTFSGGSLILLAFLIALMFTVMPAVSGGKPNYIAFLSVFLIYFAGIQPKMTLNIEDYYTGQVSSVANIPLIVGLPASVASTISYELSKLIETTMSSPQTNTSFREGGFSDPLKLIYSLRPGNKGVASANPYFSASLESFIKDCAVWSTSWDKQKAMSSPALSTYLLDFTALPVAGLTVYFDAANQHGTTMTCQTSQAYLSGMVTSLGSGTNPLVSASGLANIIKGSDGERPVPVPAGMEVTKLTNAFNDVTNGLLTGQQDAQQFMVNMIAMQPLKDGTQCANAVSAQYIGCIKEAQIFSAMEQARLDQAAGASIFAKTVIPMMNIVMLLFYLFSPILLIAAMMFSSKSVQIIGGYIMFAVWTQSWLPTAMVINYIINMQAADALAQIASGGVTMMNVHQFYGTMAIQIGLASELFAMTPMITMALLSGSAYGLTQLSGAMNQKDHFDEKAMAPDAISNGAVVKNGNVLDAESAARMVNTSGTIGDRNLVQLGNSGAQSGVHETIKTDAAASADVGRATALSHKADQARSKAQAVVNGDSTQREWTNGKAEKIAHAIETSDQDASRSLESVSSTTMSDKKYTQSQRKSLEGYVAASAGTPGIFEAAAGVKLEAGIKAATGVSDDEARSIAKSLQSQYSTENSHLRALTKKDSTGQETSIQKSLKSAVQHSDQETLQETTAASVSAANEVKATTKYAVGSHASSSTTTDVTAAKMTEDERFQAMAHLTNFATQPNSDGGAGFKSTSSFNDAVERKLAATPSSFRNLPGARMSSMMDVLSTSGQNGLAEVGRITRGAYGGAPIAAPEMTANETSEVAAITATGEQAANAAHQVTEQVGGKVEPAKHIGPVQKFKESKHDSTIKGTKDNIASDLKDGRPRQVSSVDVAPVSAAIYTKENDDFHQGVQAIEAKAGTQSVIARGAAGAGTAIARPFSDSEQSVREGQSFATGAIAATLGGDENAAGLDGNNLGGHSSLTPNTPSSEVDVAPRKSEKKQPFVSTAFDSYGVALDYSAPAKVLRGESPLDAETYSGQPTPEKIESASAHGTPEKKFNIVDQKINKDRTLHRGPKRPGKKAGS